MTQKPQPSWPADYPQLAPSEAMACRCMWLNWNLDDPKRDTKPDPNCAHCHGTGLVRHPKPKTN